MGCAIWKPCEQRRRNIHAIAQNRAPQDKLWTQVESSGGRVAVTPTDSRGRVQSIKEGENLSPNSIGASSAVMSNLIEAADSALRGGAL